MTYKSSVDASDFHPDTVSFFAGKSVLVTGGCGFIGSHVVEQLLALGAIPASVSRSGEHKILAALPSPIDVLRADLTKSADVDALLEKDDFDVVMHLAADVGGLSYNLAHPASIFDSNMRMALNVLAAAQRVGMSRTLLCSSACVYPRFCTVPTPEDEGFKDEPEPTNAGYGWSKRMLEFLGKQYSEEFGLSVAIARPYNAYGPRDEFDPNRSHVIPALIRKAFEADSAFDVWGDGATSRSFVYVDDFARGLIEVAARYPEADALNIGAEEEVQIAALARMIAEIVGEKTGRKLGPVFDPTAPTGQPRRNCLTTKAREKIGFEAKITLAEGLRKTIDWYDEYEHSADHSC